MDTKQKLERHVEEKEKVLGGTVRKEETEFKSKDPVTNENVKVKETRKIEKD